MLCVLRSLRKPRTAHRECGLAEDGEKMLVSLSSLILAAIVVAVEEGWRKGYGRHGHGACLGIMTSTSMHQLVQSHVLQRYSSYSRPHCAGKLETDVGREG